jgi:hypothetical protein
LRFCADVGFVSTSSLTWKVAEGPASSATSQARSIGIACVAGPGEPDGIRYSSTSPTPVSRSRFCVRDGRADEVEAREGASEGRTARPLGVGRKESRGILRTCSSERNSGDEEERSRIGLGRDWRGLRGEGEEATALSSCFREDFEGLEGPPASVCCDLINTTGT